MYVRNRKAPKGLFNGLVFDGSLAGVHRGSTYYHDASGYGNNASVTQGSPYWTVEDNRHVIYLKDNGNAVLNDVLETPVMEVVKRDGVTTLLVRFHSTKIANNRRCIVSTTSAGQQIEVNNTSLELQWQGNNLHGFATEVLDAAYIGGTIAQVGVISDYPGNKAYGIYNGQIIQLTQNGLGFSDERWPPSRCNTALRFGRFLSWDNYGGLNGVVIDPMLWHRTLTPPEVQWLASPANHLRVPWRRTVWPASAAGPTFNPAWAARCNNLIGAGI